MVGCLGDCDGSGFVTINEVLIMVSMALGDAPATACLCATSEAYQVPIDITEIIRAVNNALADCPAP